MDRPDQKGVGGATERRLAVLLVLCVAVVVFWEAAALFSRRPFEPFQLTAEDFRNFEPASEQWAIHPMPVGADPAEPNILAYEFSRPPRRREALESQERPMAPEESGAARGSVMVRLVHGYNMCDCMRIKGYQVELVREIGRQEAGFQVSGVSAAHGGPGSVRAAADTEVGPPGGTQRSATQVSEISPAGGIEDREASLPDPASRRQVWRLTSATREASIWITGMIRAGDFSGTDVDVRSLAFPRVGIPDDPRWVPRGVTWASLRHPIGNFRSFLRAKWNSSRCDLATFLGLRQPAWANDALLPLVAAWRGPPVPREREPAVSAEVLAAYDALYAELRKWRSANEAP